MQYSPAGGPVSPAADRRLLVSYDNYAAAQRAVDTLSDAGFPVENTAIVGSDLRLEETVTGRLTNGKAALSGLITGAVFGLIVGLFLGLFTSATTSFFGLVLWSILWGAIAGAAFGFTSHAFTGGTRDFSSRSSIVAGRYDVLVASPMLDQAQALLEGGVQPADTVVVQRPPSAGPVTTSPAAGDTAPQAPAYPAAEDRVETRAEEARAEEARAEAARAEEARAEEARAEAARDDDRAGLSRGRRP
ncbi:general stress protein [Microbispora rosea]|uniref:general stress protein n=1 Tax=Microbispora rosea TaxID=58117 RepID=UPI003448DE89